MADFKESNPKTRKWAMSTAMLILDKRGGSIDFAEVLELTLALDGFICKGLTDGSFVKYCIRNSEPPKIEQP